MKNILFVLLLSVPAFSYAGMDQQGNPALDPEAPPYAQNAHDAKRENRDADGIHLLTEVLIHIRDSYYKDVHFNVCIPAILRGGVSECTDRYSFYLDPAAVNEEDEIFTNGKLAGIGATLEINKDGGAKILDIIDGSPAEKSGLMQDDVIVAVSSGVAASSETFTVLGKMPLERIVKFIRGPQGTEVSLMVIRNGERKKFLVIRDIVQIQFVKYKLIKEKVGYIRVREFGGDVADQFYNAMENLDRSGVQSVIIDLRNNGGGKVGSVLDMCSLFVKTKSSHATILYVRSRRGPFKDVTVLANGKFKNKHIVILQNGNSASASEIFSGYMKYETGAVVVGTNSFGKGIMQSLIPLSNKGELHLTTNEYFIGRNLIKVQGIGIAPTIEVNQDKPAKTEQEDVQLQRAILEAEKLVK